MSAYLQWLLPPPAVEVDLAAPSFRPGKPSYERVKWCLTDRLGLEAPFIISWWPEGQEAGVQISVAKRSVEVAHKLDEYAS